MSRNEPRRVAGHRIVIAAGLCLGAILALGSAAAHAAPAAPASTPEVREGRYLRVVSYADWHTAGALSPGDRVHWDLSVSANAPHPGTVSLSIDAAGSTPLALEASSCTVAWTTDGCAGGTQPLRAFWHPAPDRAPVTLTSFPDHETAHIRLAVSLGPNAVAGSGTTTLRVQAEGIGEAVSVSGGAAPETPNEMALALTGFASQYWFVLAATGLVAGSALVLAAAILTDRRERRAEAQARGAVR